MLCSAQEAPVPGMLVCEPWWEGSGADSPQLGQHKAEWLFGVCVLASCAGWEGLCSNLG